MRFRGLVPLSSRKSKEYLRGLQLLVQHYKKGGFIVKRINCDMEFKPIMDVVHEKLNIMINYANAGDHVPEAERNNRTIKERFRAAFHRMPFKAMPRIMIRFWQWNAQIS